MKTTAKWNTILTSNTKWITGGILALAVVALSALVLIPRLSSPEQPPPAAPAYWPRQSWQSGTPEEQGLDSAKLADALLVMRKTNVHIHSLLLIRNGKLMVDAYFYPYDGQTAHELASVTKSVMTTLIGIAADQGKLKLDQPMVSFFPDRTIANRDAAKEAITVRHLASMSSGLDCTASGDEMTLKEMKASADWVQFALDRKVIWEPGRHFVYCSPGMHLLSAILQQATGMSALDFARANLFEPLGIRDVIWLTDPQGYNRGSEGVYLHPRDAAKIGYLWLNHGQWDGRQVVSRAWVEQSVQVQSRVGDGGDDYGYGWWVKTDDARSYSAEGRGGQHVGVLPAWNLVVVTTGGGFSLPEIDPLLRAAIVDMNRALPANPGGMANLQAAVTTVAQSPTPSPAAPLPETAGMISGKTFVFDSNASGIAALGLDFDGMDEAILRLRLAGSEQMASAPVGLDGVYRMTSGEHNLPRGFRGAWTDAQTFALEYDAIANNDHTLLRMRFEGDKVTVTAQETAHEVGMKFEGRVQNP